MSLKCQGKLHFILFFKKQFGFAGMAMIGNNFPTSKILARRTIDAEALAILGVMGTGQYPTRIPTSNDLLFVQKKKRHRSVGCHINYSIPPEQDLQARFLSKFFNEHPAMYDVLLRERRLIIPH